MNNKRITFFFFCFIIFLFVAWFIYLFSLPKAGANELPSQWERLEVFDDKDCPIDYHIPDNTRRRILSMGPPSCGPLHIEPHHSIWPAGCFLWITKQGYGLEKILYSNWCEISITDLTYEEGV